MLPDKEIGCHRTGFTRKCRELVTSGECKRFIQVDGRNPMSGEHVSRWDCVDNWMPLLMIDNTQQVRQTAAAIESFRNEMVHLNGVAAVQHAVLKRPCDEPLLLSHHDAAE